MRDDDIKAMLRAAGIPREAFKSTLYREGYVEVKEWVAAPDGAPIAYITEAPSLRTIPESKYLDYLQSAEDLFYLAAKEYALSGSNVYCCDLMDLHSMWIGADADDAMYQKVSDASVLCIRGFYERTPTPLTSYEAHRMASRLTTLSRGGVVLVLLCAATPTDSKESPRDWWPPSLLAYLRRVSATFEAKP